MEEKVLDLLEEVCEDDVVREDLDMDLFEEDILDSLGFAELLTMIEDELGVIIAPSEVVREQVNTANKIIALVKEKSEN
ncbi:D-alanine--poly(phosphoribitol) ligase subunit DltC [uncultured Eubacterium sp.]|mgnify:FL=1|uniref:D-alanine--poly(phosphoribitol) ligase subunit DltC n=1 Tax=uncultured Eubacterium sp. TaxID=165185 RepID=UPI002673646D|nr:D-alanine--poly(phosphoribitol) ligase subunit DltC [uncultured Eubacterium sp.]